MNSTISQNSNKKKRKLDPSIIRIGDDVKIIVPEAFDRVGYPLTKKIIVESMTREQKDKLNKAVVEIFGLSYMDDNTVMAAFGQEIANESLFYAIADRILNEKRWGGSDRKIYTNPIPDFCIGQVSNVLSKKVVKTGKYVPGWSGCDYWGEYDSSPAYLENEKTHVLYEMLVLTDFSKGGYINAYENMFFEKRCIQKVIYNRYTGEYE
jgi:hypothetical protein